MRIYIDTLVIRFIDFVNGRKLVFINGYYNKDRVTLHVYVLYARARAHARTHNVTRSIIYARHT